MKLKTVALAAIVANGFLAASAATIKVDASGEWEGSVKTLDEAYALHKAAGDTILVRPGTYYPTNQLAIGYANFTIRSCDADGQIDAAHTIIDGSQCPTRGFYSRISNPTFDGLTFRNFAPKSAGNGGVMNFNGTGKWNVLNCTFDGNAVTNSDGGAIYSYVCNAGVVSNCTFRSNRVVGAGYYCGGAIYTQQNGESATDRCTVYNSVFTNNTVVTTGGCCGGAIYAFRCIYLYDCDFDNNMARSPGNGVSGGQVSVGVCSRLERCAIRTTDLSVSMAGNYYGTLLQLANGQYHVVSDCTFGPVTTGTTGYGTISVDNASSNEFVHCRFTGLKISANWFFIQSSSAILRNCLFADSGTGSGGFWYFSKPGAWLFENCTFLYASDNTALNSTAATYVNCLGNVTVADATHTTNCLFAGTLDACLLEDPANGLYYPIVGSPAHDGGLARDWHDGASDICGRARVVGAAVDIGAVERQTTDPDQHHIRVVANEADRTGEWVDAYTNIQEAVDAVASRGLKGCEIFLKGGTYALNESVSIAGTMTLSSRATIGGGLNRDAVVLDGQGVCRPLTIDNQSLYDITVEGLTVKNGYSSESGGGIYAYGPDDGEEAGAAAKGFVLINDCFVTNCTAGVKGGGLAIGQGVVVSNCVVVGNASAKEGGGIYSWVRSQVHYKSMPAKRYKCPAIFYTHVLNNANGSGYGGGIFTEWSCLIDHCLIEGNTAKGGGNGVYASHYMWMRDTVVRNNSGGAYGYNLCAGGTDSVYERNVFTGAKTGYGSVWDFNDKTLFDRCSFTNNTCNSLYLQSSVTLRDCLLDSSPEVFVGQLSADNCTFNCGVSQRSDANGATVLRNCIVTGAISSNYTTGKRHFWATNCCFATALPVDKTGTNLVTSACFTYKPCFRNAAAGDYRLNAGSRCRERGETLSWQSADSVDFYGQPRLVNRQGVANAEDARPDLGCAEIQDPIRGVVLSIQ